MSGSAPLDSDHWYRVASQRPKLRPDVVTHFHTVRGREWVLLRDPISDRFVRMHSTAWAFVCRLDGEATAEEALASANQTFGDTEISQVEAIQLLGWLHRVHLLRPGSVPDPGELDRLREDLGDRRRNRLWMSLLSPRMPLWNPDRLLTHLAPLTQAAFSWPGLALWVAVMCVAAVSLLGRGADLLAAGREVFDPDPLRAASLLVCFIGIKVVHEFAHGVAAKHFGRRAGIDASVRSMGILWIALLPVPYVDASGSWGLRNKWERAAVAMAGMYGELFLAALAALVWSATGVGWLHTAAYHVMFVAGATTLLANANPLLRFDAYYALSDVLEIPNLSSRGRDAWIYLGKRALGVRQLVVPWFDSGERAWLLLYGAASGAFRIFVLFWLVLLLADRAFFIGAALAVFGFYAWFLKPSLGLMAYLIGSPELAAAGRQAKLVSAGALATMGVLLFVLPVPDRDLALGSLEPQQLTPIFLPDEGFLVGSLPADHHAQPDGLPLVELDNPELRARLAQARAAEAATLVRLRDALGRDPRRSRHLQEDLTVLTERRQRLEARAAALAIKAPFAGTWLPGPLEALEGSFLRADTDQPVGWLADFRQFVVRVAADQELGPRLIETLSEGSSVELRLHSDPGQRIEGTLLGFVPGGLREPPSAALQLGAGGSLRTLAGEGSEGSLAEPYFEVQVAPDPDRLGAIARSGERVTVRFDLGSAPLGVQWWRSLRQLLQKRLAG